jgi:hypothetical protein
LGWFSSAVAEHGLTDRRLTILEISLAVLMGLAALATAFTAYKSGQAGGNTTSAYTFAINNTNDANQQYLEGNQQVVSDEAVFLEYVKAIQQDDTELAAYIRESLMGEDLLKGLKWWEKQPDENTPPSPVDVDNPDYNVAAYVNAAQFTRRAKAHIIEAKRADTLGGRYDLVTVLFAAALFVFGISSTVRRLEIKLGVTALGLIMFIGSVVQLARITWA